MGWIRRNSRRNVDNNTYIKEKLFKQPNFTPQGTRKKKKTNPKLAEGK